MISSSIFTCKSSCVWITIYTESFTDPNFALGFAFFLLIFLWFSTANSKVLTHEEIINEEINIIKNPTSSDVEMFFAFQRLRGFGRKSVPAFIQALQDTRPIVRENAAFYLGIVEPEAKVAVPALIKALQDQNPNVRGNAAFSLGRIGPEAKAAVPPLTRALQDQNPRVRKNAAVALGWIGPGAKAAVPTLIKALQDQDIYVRESTASSLSRMGSTAQTAIPYIVAAFNRSDVSDRQVAGQAIVKIAQTYISTMNSMGRSSIKQKLIELENLQATFFKEINDKNITEDLNHIILALQAQYKAFFLIYLSEWLEKHKMALAVSAYFFLIPFWFLLLWIRPLWLFWLNEKLFNVSLSLKPFGFSDLRFGLPQILLLSFFHYQPRILDALIRAYLKKGRRRFSDLKTVQARAIYVPIPVTLNGHTIVQPTARDFQVLLQKDRFCLLIWGEGGAGKTSMACHLAGWAMTEESRLRLAGHPMLPVLIEHDLTLEIEAGGHPLIEAIRKQVELMTGAKEISPKLLHHFLRCQRLLVIIDHYSELSQATRERIQPGHDPKLAINAMVVTSRQEEEFQGSVTDTLKPLRIQGNRLSSFMEIYLTHLRKRELYDDPEFFDACRRLSQMVGDRNITVLLARLYADQMIAAIEDPAFKDLPENIPDLMLRYLNWINRHGSEKNPGNRAVHRIAKVISWISLAQSFRPVDASLTVIQAALAGEKNIEQKLQYLCRDLGIIQFVGPAEEKVRISLDPLAEYLAGLYILELYGSDELQWRSFLEEADKKEGAPESIQGFLLAVRDCCLARKQQIRIPDFVIEELSRRAGLDPKTIQQARLKQRLEQLISNLTSGLEPEDRMTAARSLGNIGPAAAAAIPFLQKALQDKDGSVRKTAAEALGNIGPAAAATVPDLIKAFLDESKGVRSIVGQALWKIGPADDSVIPDLIQALNHDQALVKQAAAKALRKIGPSATDAVPALIHASGDRDATMRIYAIEALGAIGLPAKDVVASLIHALEDKSKNVRMNAAVALGNIGPGAAEALPHLIKLLREDKSVRRAIAGVLGKIGLSSSEGIQALIEVLEDPDLVVRRTAAKSLGKFGPAASEAVPELIRAVNNTNKSLRKAAAKALGNIGATATDAVPVLIKALQDKDGDITGVAVDVLRKIGRTNENVVPSLIQVLEAKDADVRKHAAGALGKIGPGAAAAVPGLIKVLQDQIWYVRAAAAQALGEIGSAAMSAVNPLKEACQDPQIKEIATQALQKIQGDFSR